MILVTHANGRDAFPFASSCLICPNTEALQVFARGGKELALYAPEQWLNAVRLDGDDHYSIDVQGTKYIIPKEDAREFWNELGRAMQMQTECAPE